MKDFLVIFFAILVFQYTFKFLFGFTPEDLFWLFLEMIQSVRSFVSDWWAVISILLALAVPPLVYQAWRSVIGHS